MKDNVIDFYKKEIIVFSEGDASKLETWSNVPYFFTKWLEEYGCIVHRVDISIEALSLIEKVVLNIVDKFLVAWKLVTRCDWAFDKKRTVLFGMMRNRIVKSAWKEYPNSNEQIVLSFSCVGPKKLHKKTILVGDWTYEYFLEMQQKRKPGLLEKLYIKRENSNIMVADAVVSLFPDPKDYIQNKCKREVFFLDYVVNSNYDNFKKDLALKFKSVSFVFVGNRRYLESAVKLVEAIDYLNKQGHGNIYTVDIIGLESKDSDVFNKAFVNCYGYLNKSVKDDNRLYYEKIVGAKAIVNVTDEWNGMSSLIEAMYYYTPIIIVPNANITKFFGTNNNKKYGYWCQDSSLESLIKGLEFVCELDEVVYSDICEYAHELVQNYTWDNYIDKVLNL